MPGVRAEGGRVGDGRRAGKSGIGHTEPGIPRQRGGDGSGAKAEAGVVPVGDSLGQLPPRTLAPPSPKQQ